MKLSVFLDSGPLGLVTNPKKTPDTIAAAQWVIHMEAAGHRFYVPAIADFEVRRELVRSGKKNGLARLDIFNAAEADRFVSVQQLTGCKQKPPLTMNCRQGRQSGKPETQAS